MELISHFSALLEFRLVVGPYFQVVVNEPVRFAVLPHQKSGFLSLAGEEECSYAVKQPLIACFYRSFGNLSLISLASAVYALAPLLSEAYS